MTAAPVMGGRAGCKSRDMGLRRKAIVGKEGGQPCLTDCTDRLSIRGVVSGCTWSWEASHWGSGQRHHGCTLGQMA